MKFSTHYKVWNVASIWYRLTNHFVPLLLYVTAITKHLHIAQKPNTSMPHYFAHECKLPKIATLNPCIFKTPVLIGPVFGLVVVLGCYLKFIKFQACTNFPSTFVSWKLFASFNQQFFATWVFKISPWNSYQTWK